MSFMTEREMESLLEMETRTVSMPDGKQHSITGFRTLWLTLQYVIDTYEVQLEWIVELALNEKKDFYDNDFSLAFRKTVHRVAEKLDKDAGLI
jgi:hypothetical protein